MKNNEITYEVQDASSFVAVMTGALLPDHVIQHYANETPWFVKRAVEMLFLDGRGLDECNDMERADAFFINALIAIQREIKEQTGESDFTGMIAAYIMRNEYEGIFKSMEDAGFAGAYNAIKEDGGWSEEDFFGDQQPSPWEQRGINLN